MIRRANDLIALPAADVTRARDFYRDVLGFPVLYEEEGFVIFDTGRTQLGIHGRSAPMPEPDPEGVWLWLEVADLDRAREALAGRGVQLVGEKRFLGVGWDQAFLDSEGNVLRLYQPLEEVRREVVIEAAPERVFAALTDARAIEEWFAAIDDVVLEPRVGGRISFVDPLYGRVEGEVVELVPAARLVFSFTRNWPARLEFRLTAVENGTRLEVHQTGFEQIRDRDYNIALLVENLEAALRGLAEHARRVAHRG